MVISGNPSKTKLTFKNLDIEKIIKSHNKERAALNNKNSSSQQENLSIWK